MIDFNKDFWDRPVEDVARALAAAANATGYRNADGSEFSAEEAVVIAEAVAQLLHGAVHPQEGAWHKA